MKKYIYSVCFSFVLAAFTLFVVLDTFVISRPMEYVQEQINTSMFSSNKNASKSDSVVSSEKTLITAAAPFLKQPQKML